MKSLRRMLKLLPPACLMRVWLRWRYGMSVPQAPGGIVGRAALAVLPYAFSAALSQRVATDNRLVKYYLPYGRMKRHVLATYGMKVGNDARDRGLGGCVRAVMPYGIVLWWDAECARLCAPIKGDDSVGSLGVVDFGFPMSVRLDPSRDRLDRIETLGLRLAIVYGDHALRDYRRESCDKESKDV